MSSYAQFTSCTPLISSGSTGPTPHRVTLMWGYSEDIPESATYGRVELFRWIGSKGSCGFTDSFTFEERYKITEWTEGTGSITDVTSYTDDLSEYYYGTTTKARLGVVIGEPVLTDRQILDEVYTTQRPIYYIIRTTLGGGGGIFDLLPYVIYSHTLENVVQAISTKTQVKHNILHLEGERIWASIVRQPDGDIPRNISRTAMDPSRVFGDPGVHASPWGRGGWAWVAHRSRGRNYPSPKPSFIFRFDLANGRLTRTYRCDPGQPDDMEKGFGIVVDYRTGDCYGGTIRSAGNKGKLFKCLAEDVENNTNAMVVADIATGYKGVNYGMVVQAGNPDTFYYNSIYDLKEIRRLAYTGTGWQDALWYKRGGSSGYPYGLASGPDGTIFSTRQNAGSNSSKMLDYRGLSHSTRQETQLFTDLNGHEDSKGVGTDYATLYPNEGTNSYRVFAVNVTKNCMAYKTYSMNSNSFIGNSTQINTGFESYGVACDDSNNMWIVGQEYAHGDGRLKKWYAMKNDTTYPYGGKSRYPSVRLSEWRSTPTNTREIEWFLTRDPAFMDATALSEYVSYIQQSSWNYTGLNTTVSFVCGATVNNLYTAASATDIANIIAWDTARGTGSQNICGRRIYPNYLYEGQLQDFSNVCVNIAPGNTWNKKKVWGKGYHYSDFTGSLLLAAVPNLEDWSLSEYDTTYPEPTPPTIKLTIQSASQRAPLNESLTQYPWRNVYYSPTSNSTQVTGYDDLTVAYLACASSGTYVITGWNFENGDYERDYGSVVGNVTSEFVYTNQIYIPSLTYTAVASSLHTYHDSTRVGLSANLRNDDRQPTGTFIAIVTAFSYKNPYAVGCPSLSSVSNTASVIVLERWPEARHYVNITDSFATRLGWFGCPLIWKPSGRFQKSAGYVNSVDKYVPNNVAYGTDPLDTAIVYDKSIARTYPLSSWYLSLSTTNIWSTDISNRWKTGSGTWPYISSMMFYSSADASANASIYGYGLALAADSINSELNGTSALLFSAANLRYGVYGITLTVYASNSYTPSPAELTFAQYICVKEFEPFANFWAISAVTVPAWYSDDAGFSAASSALDVYVGTSHSQLISDAEYLSGHAPHFTVWFQDSSEAHTFPISSYHWDFGDGFDESTNTVIVSTTILDGLFDNGCWSMDGFEANKSAILVKGTTSHWVKHTYVMPGVYDVTLCVQASATSMQDCCAKYVPENSFYVYVEEISPQCCFTTSLSALTDYTMPVSGTAPLTVYFNTSCIIAGSFPICRVDYDFNDGSDIDTVTRIPFATTSKNGVPLICANYHPEYTQDPRNFIISHIYDTDSLTGETFTPRISVYACNTNTMVECTCGTPIGPFYSPTATIRADSRHLIGSRYINDSSDLLYLFEGDTQKTVYTVVLSGED